MISTIAVLLVAVFALPAAMPQQQGEDRVEPSKSTVSGLGSFDPGESYGAPSVETVVIHHGAVRTVQPPDGPKVAVFRRPGSEATPAAKLRVLVLGTGADWSSVKDAADNPRITTPDGHPYDVILGPCTNPETLAGAPAGVRQAYDLNNRVIWQAFNRDEAVEQSRVLLDVLRSETGIEKGPIPLSDLDMHSNGVSVGAPLLGEMLEPSHVRAVGPAAGRDEWALNDLVAYSKGKGRKVAIYADVRDPIFPASSFSLKGLAQGAEVVAEQFAGWVLENVLNVEFDLSGDRPDLIEKQSKHSTEAGSLEFHAMDMGDLKGLFSEHSYENYITAIKEGRFATSADRMAFIFAALKARDAQPAGAPIRLSDSSVSPLPMPPSTWGKAVASGELVESDYFFRLQMREKLPTTADPVRRRLSHAAQTRNGSRANLSPAQRPGARRITVRQSNPSRRPPVPPPAGRPCSTCGGSGNDTAAMAQARSKIPEIQKLIDEAVRLINSLPDVVRDSHGNIIVDHRPLKQQKRVLIAMWEADKRRMQQPVRCKICGGAGFTRP